MSEEKELKGKECRFAIYIPPYEQGAPDLHVVKEVLHYTDGTLQTQMKMVYDYERPFWVTKKGFRTYNQYKAWEDISKLTQYTCTQTALPERIAQALNKRHLLKNRRALMSNPYLYGSDISAASLIKAEYLEKWPELNSFWEVAVLDIETDVVRGEDDILMCTLSFKKRIYTAVTKKAVAAFVGDIVSQIKDLAWQHIGEILDSRGITRESLEVEIVEDEPEMIKRVFAKANEWKPDFITIWNMDFDLPYIARRMELHNVDLRDILIDESVPKEYKYVNYIKGSTHKVTQSGQKTAKAGSQQWHTMVCPTSYYFIDAMCSYRQLRIGAQNEPSYSLDAILTKELDLTKLKFKATEHLKGLEQHRVMQQNYMLEYIVYNIFDCIGVEMLDEKTKDLCVSLPLNSGVSDFKNFARQPRRLCDDIFFYLKENGKILSSTAQDLVSELDNELMSREDWIVNLPAALTHLNGIQVIAEDPELNTNGRAFVADLDVKAAYPNGIIIYNMSKETTARELCGIEGFDEEYFRPQNMQLLSGSTDSVEYCTSMFGFPELMDLYKKIKTQI